MLVTRFTGLYPYQVIDAIKDGRQVMCMNRAGGNAFLIGKLSLEEALRILKEAEESEDNKGSSYKNVPQYDFWYGEIKEEAEVEECSE